VTVAHIGEIVYALDDQTVGIYSDSSNYIAAGTVLDVTSDGVWVDHGAPGGPSPVTAN
jgi:hypothetical protein